jgi:hypothetical protein
MRIDGSIFSSERQPPSWALADGKFFLRGSSALRATEAQRRAHDVGAEEPQEKAGSHGREED